MLRLFSLFGPKNTHKWTVNWANSGVHRFFRASPFVYKDKPFIQPAPARKSKFSKPEDDDDDEKPVKKVKSTDDIEKRKKEQQERELKKKETKLKQLERNKAQKEKEAAKGAKKKT